MSRGHISHPVAIKAYESVATDSNTEDDNSSMNTIIAFMSYLKHESQQWECQVAGGS